MRHAPVSDHHSLAPSFQTQCSLLGMTAGPFSPPPASSQLCLPHCRRLSVGQAPLTTQLSLSLPSNRFRGEGGTSLSLSTILACVTLETGPGSKTHRSSPTTLTHGLTANNCSVYQCFQLANTVCSRGEAGARRGGGGGEVHGVTSCLGGKEGWWKVHGVRAVWEVRRV